MRVGGPEQVSGSVKWGQMRKGDLGSRSGSSGA